eukprot:746248-Hanusia_phi.AAC.2
MSIRDDSRGTDYLEPLNCPSKERRPYGLERTHGEDRAALGSGGYRHRGPGRAAARLPSSEFLSRLAWARRPGDGLRGLQ